MDKPKLLTTSDLWTVPNPPVLVDDLISRYGITGLSSEPGVGKTFFALSMALSVATGAGFLKKFGVRPGAVLFVGQDASLMEYARQHRKVAGEYWRRLLDQSGSDDPATSIGATEDLASLDSRLKFWIHGGLRLDAADHVMELARLANGVSFRLGEAERTEEYDPDTGEIEESWSDPIQRGVSLIVLDTLSSMHTCNENDNMQMQQVFSNLRMLAEDTRAAILVLHHLAKANEFNKEADRWRGASSQLGVLDGHLELARGNNGLVWVRIRKFRGVRIEDFAFEMIADEEKVDLTYRGVRGETDPFIESVREFVDATGELFKSSDVVAHVRRAWPLAENVDKRVSKMLEALSKDGKLTKVAKGQWVRPPQDQGDHDA